MISPATVFSGPIFAWQKLSLIVLSKETKNHLINFLASSLSVINGSRSLSILPIYTGYLVTEGTWW